MAAWAIRVALYCGVGASRRLVSAQTLFRLVLWRGGASDSQRMCRVFTVWVCLVSLPVSSRRFCALAPSCPIFFPFFSFPVCLWVSRRVCLWTALLCCVSVSGGRERERERERSGGVRMREVAPFHVQWTLSLFFCRARRLPSGSSTALVSGAGRLKTAQPQLSRCGACFEDLQGLGSVTNCLLKNVGSSVSRRRAVRSADVSLAPPRGAGGWVRRAATRQLPGWSCQ